MASTSTAYAARQNGVVWSRYSSPQLALPQLLNAKYQRFFVRRTFTSAPAAIMASISSRYVVFCTRMACGCGKRERGNHCVLMAAYSGVAPAVLAMRTSAPRSISTLARSNCPLMVASNNGDVLSAAVT